MNKVVLDNLAMAIKYRLHICQKPGCWHRDAVPCYLPVPCYLAPDQEIENLDDKPDYFYCANHAQSEGFCLICGQFWGGIESFDFGPGWCENCAPQIEDDCLDFEEEGDCDYP